MVNMKSRRDISMATRIFAMAAAIIMAMLCAAAPVHADEWDENTGETAPASFTWYNQLSNPIVWIGDGNMVSNGCVPTSAAMLSSAYGVYMSPEEWGWYLYETGNFDNFYGHGGSDLCWYDVAGRLGIGAWGIYDYGSMVYALQNGATCACHIYVSGGTHAVLATGYRNGMTTVYDTVAGIDTRSVASLWNSRFFVWNDCLSGTSITALQ